MKSGTKIARALSVALILCLLMGVTTMTALADTQDPKPTATITAKKTFTVDNAANNVKLTEAKFTLTSVSYTGDTAGTEVPMPTTTVKTAALTANGTSAEGTVAFDAISYTVPGIYTYKLVETVETPVNGVTYDTAERFINVYVTNCIDSDGKIIFNDDGTPYVKVAFITVWKTANGTLNWDDFSLDKPDTTGNKTGETGTADGVNNAVTVNFTNTFGDVDKKTMIVVKKTVEGELGNPDQEFDFTLATSSTNLLAYQVFDENDAAVAGKSGAIATGGTFKLKHGETAHIYNLADGDKYTVTESNGAIADTYKTSITGKAGGTAITAVTDVTTLAKTAGEQTFAIDAEDSQAFVNAKGYNPPTGVTLEILPFVVMIALAGVLAAALFIKKRGTDSK